MKEVRGFGSPETFLPLYFQHVLKGVQTCRISLYSLHLFHLLEFLIMRHTVDDTSNMVVVVLLFPKCRIELMTLLT